MPLPSQWSPRSAGRLPATRHRGGQWYQHKYGKSAKGCVLKVMTRNAQPPAELVQIRMADLPADLIAIR
jgi:hypothetical protein